MNRLFLIFAFTVALEFNSLSQGAHYAKSELDDKTILAPKYIFGYPAVADSLFNLIISYRIPHDSIFTYIATFAIKFDKYGKIMKQNYHIYVPQMSYVFSKIADTLPVWVKRIDHWIPAYNKRTKNPIPNYTLYFVVELNTAIWISFGDKKGLKKDLYKAAYPIPYP